MVKIKAVDESWEAQFPEPNAARGSALCCSQLHSHRDFTDMIHSSTSHGSRPQKAKELIDGEGDLLLPKKPSRLR